MRNTLARLGMVVAFATGLVSAATMATAQEGQEVAPQADGVQVGIVEPAFRPPSAWSYDPIDVTVPVGTPVTWSNAGAVVHTVTADDGVSFDSGTLGPQEVFQFTPRTPGTFAYHCTIHPWMAGSLTVTP